MDVIALARAGSRLQHADQMLTQVRDRLTAGARRSGGERTQGMDDNKAVAVLSDVHKPVAQARDDVLVAYGIATVTLALKSKAQDRALDAYGTLAGLADGLDDTLAALQLAGADATLLSCACQTLGQAVVHLARGIGDDDLAAGGDGRTPVRLAMQFTVHAEATAGSANPPTPAAPSR
ncbi:hypothetical protein CTZ27_30060 [Streptomyces griseocarneus]|nr:hypothetical protein CTZ27_30060 [Streptomyces griseocarneus]